MSTPTLTEPAPPAHQDASGPSSALHGAEGTPTAALELPQDLLDQITEGPLSALIEIAKETLNALKTAADLGEILEITDAAIDEIYSRSAELRNTEFYTIGAAIIRLLRDRIKAAHMDRPITDLRALVGIISHDLNNLLMGVIGALELVKKHIPSSPDKVSPLLAIADSSATGMTPLVKSLLEFSRIGTTLAAPPHSTDAKQVVDSLRPEFQVEAGENPLQIIVEGELPVCRVNTNLLEHIFRNLFSNALKYCGDNPAVVVVSGKIEGDTVHFSVGDVGMGIPDGALSRVFSPADRLGREESGIHGNGLALAFIKHAIETSGGKIWVESEGVGRGCVFHFTLPNPPEEREE